MIRNTIILEIKKEIDSDKNFSSTDFAITTENNSLKITYEYDENFFFQLNVPKEISKLSRTEKETTMGLTTKHKEIQYEEYEFSGTQSPGTIARIESVEFEGKRLLLGKIRVWLKNLWDEITIQPNLRKIEQIEEEVQVMKEMFTNASEDFFSKEEAEKLKLQLNDLENKFKERLETEIQDKDLLIAALTELHNELEKLKNQTTVLNKKNWFKSCGVKLLTWISKEENRKFLKESKDFLKPLLPAAIEKVL
ncbi:hypothetical protein ACTHGU_07655 [Chitinophagaceae bacterium MMS25-I14]